MQARQVFLGGVVVAVADAAIEATQQAVALRARLPDALENPVDRHAKQHECVRGKHQAGFQRLRDDLGGACPGQAFHIPLVGGSYDDRQVGARFGGVVHDALGERGVADRDDDHAGPHQAGRDQRLLAPGVGEDHALAAGCRLAHTVRVEVEGDVVDTFLAQEACQVLAAATEAAQEGVFFRTHRLGGNLRQLHRAQQPFAGHEAHDDLLAVMHDERGGEHRQDEGGQGDLLGDLGYLRHFAEQHEAEFAAGAQPEGGTDGIARRCPEAPREHADDQPFGREECSQGEQYLPPVVDQDVRIELDADGHEEEAHQYVAEGLDVFFHLEAVFGFRDQHAGDEGAQGQRQPGEFGQVGEAEGDEEHVEDENLG